MGFEIEREGRGLEVKGEGLEREGSREEIQENEK